MSRGDGGTGLGSRPAILVFDSGLGGLTVYREVAAARPDADFVYLADDAAFPYGALAEPVLSGRLLALLGAAIEIHRPDLIVIACNTASTIALPELRKKFTVPFVGTVPAIKPACAASQTRRVAVLGTEATVKREYTRALIRDHGQGCKIDLIGSKELAAYAEAELNGRPVSDVALRAEIDPCFRDDGKRTDTVVLACTHDASATDCTLAGQFHRSGASHRAPRGTSPRQRGYRTRQGNLARDLHIGQSTGSDPGAVRHAGGRTGLTDRAVSVYCPFRRQRREEICRPIGLFATAHDDNFSLRHRN